MNTLQWLAFVCGWSSTIAWSVSYYPQCIENYKRKCVIGFSFDFLAYNITGFLCYATYNSLLYWDPTVRRQYHDAHGSGSVPVELNDVIFSLHAVVLVLFQIFQCFIYDRGDQKVSKTCKIQSAIVWLYIAVAVSLGLAGTITYYQMLVLLSFVKVWASFIKYTPQAYLNWLRKSTVGWNIVNVLLDFSGGVLSIMQMVFLAIDQDDSNQITGNPAKLGLGVESLFFDAIFVFQHYALYTDRRDLDAPTLEDPDPTHLRHSMNEEEGEEAQLLPPQKVGDEEDGKHGL
eukprot:TRINITY_DN81072_c0_g1_i1.p1 TRINITY_DN81072_c0_g1~~TRINITY_DN81072_c0_g1_i1.p1  ORF type:complete len:318 (+),score=49.36 TRINITY_DN81072_c0_g1_i1:91-954(+)